MKTVILKTVGFLPDHLSSLDLTRLPPQPMGSEDRLPAAETYRCPVRHAIASVVVPDTAMCFDAEDARRLAYAQLAFLAGATEVGDVQTAQDVGPDGPRTRLSAAVPFVLAVPAVEAYVRNLELRVESLGRELSRSDTRLRAAAAEHQAEEARAELRLYKETRLHALHLLVRVQRGRLGRWLVKRASRGLVDAAGAPVDPEELLDGQD